MVLKQAHTDVAVQDLPELIRQCPCSLLHFSEFLLLSQVLRCPARSRASLRSHRVAVTVVGLRFLFLGDNVFYAKGLAEETAEPAHRELVHVVEKLEILNGEVEPCTLLCCDLESFPLLSDLFLVALCLLQFLLNLRRRLLRLVQCLDEAIRFENLLSRFSQGCKDLIKDFALLFLELEALFCVALTVLLLPGQLVATDYL